MDNYKHSGKNHLWNKIHGTNRQMLYRINNYKHSERFVTNMDTQNAILSIFQSDYDFINNQLNDTHNFDIFENA